VRVTSAVSPRRVLAAQDPTGHRRAAGDEGSAVIEFVALAVLLLVPLVYLVVVLGRVQAGAFAAQAGAVSAARVYAGAPQEPVGAQRARAAVLLALRDQGFTASPDEVTSIGCERSPCLQPQARVTVRVHLDVDLPGVPGLLRRVVPVRVPVEATSVAVVDRFAGTAPKSAP
jgi:hypothetical protein